MLAIDTDTNCTTKCAALKSRGVTAVGRYYAAKGSKRLTKGEAEALSRAGLRLFTVYEDSGDPELTIERGVRDAGLALAQARAIGQPEDSAIYFALEHLPSGYNKSHIPGLKLYFEGIRQAIGPYQVGCYSNGSTLAALLDAQLIDYAWVSASTSFDGSREFLKTNRWHLAQRKVDQNWDGVSVDTNDCQGDGFGDWALPARDNVDVALRQVAQAAPAGSVAGTVAATVPEDKPALMDRLAPNAAKIEELAGQGSRIAEHIRSFKGMLWKGGGTAVAAGSAAVSLVDPNQGNAQVVGSWGSQHPFLLAALCVAVTAAVVAGYAYYKAKKIEKGLVSAANDRRYNPRGGAST